MPSPKDSYFVISGHNRGSGVESTCNICITPDSSALVKSLVEGIILKPTIHNLIRRDIEFLSADVMATNSCDEEDEIRIMSVQLSSRVTGLDVPSGGDLSLVVALAPWQSIESVLTYFKQLAYVGHEQLHRSMSTRMDKAMVAAKGQCGMLLQSLARQWDEGEVHHSHLESLSGIIRSSHFSHPLGASKCELLFADNVFEAYGADVGCEGKVFREGEDSVAGERFLQLREKGTSEIFHLGSAREQKWLHELRCGHRIYLSRSTNPEQNGAYLVDRQLGYSPCSFGYPQKLHLVCDELKILSSSSVLFEPLEIAGGAHGFALLIVAMNDGASPNLVLQSGAREYIEYAIFQAIELGIKDDLVRSDKIQKKLIRNYHEKNKLAKHFKRWSNEIFGRKEVILGVCESLRNVIEGHAYTEGEVDLVSEMRTSLQSLFYDRLIYYEQGKEGLNVDNASNRVFTAKGVANGQVDLVGVIEKGPMRGLIRISIRDARNGEEQYSATEIRVLHSFCTTMAALESFISKAKAPSFSLLQSQLPTLFVGEPVELPIIKDSPDLEACIDSIAKCNNVVISTKTQLQKELQEACEVARESIVVERAKLDAMRLKLSSSLALIMLSMHMGEAKNLQELSIIIRTKLPAVVGCAKVALLVPVSEDREIYKTVPISSSSEVTVEEGIEISLVQLQAISTFSDSDGKSTASVSGDKLSKIVLTNINTGEVSGVILCFESNEHASERWEGLREVLVNALSAYLVASFARFEFYETMVSVRTALHSLEASQKENLSLQQSLTQSKLRFSEMGSEIDRLRESANGAVWRYQKLVDLVNRHVDQKVSVHTYSILDWLIAVAEDMEVVVHIVERKGNIYSCETVPEQNTDLVGAAMDAVMNNDCIEIVSSAESDRTLRVPSTKFPALLIPNIYVASHISCRQACFAICRTDSRTFSEDERVFLTSAVNLSCRTLAIAESVPFTLEDYQLLEKDRDRTKGYLDRIRSAMKLTSALYETKSTQGLCALLETDFAAALRRVGETECLAFHANAIFYDPTKYNVLEDQRNDLKDFFKTEGLTAVQMILRELKYFRHGNKICFPVVSGATGNFVSVLLCVENRLDLDAGPTSGGTAHIESLLISDEDENVMAIVAQALTGVIENLRSLQGACEGISQAGVAIEALQQRIEAIEGSSAQEVNHTRQIMRTRVSYIRKTYL